MAAGQLRVLATEQERTGEAFGTTFAGRVDLVLGDPPRILDLKWSGADREAQGARKRDRAAAGGLRVPRAAGKRPVPARRLLRDGRPAAADDAARRPFRDAERVDGPSPGETWRLVEATHASEWRGGRRGPASGRAACRRQTARSRRRRQCVEDGRLRLPAGVRLVRLRRAVRAGVRGGSVSDIGPAPST